MPNRKPFKKQFTNPEILFDGLGERRIGFSEDDLTSKNLNVLNHGVIKPGLRLPWFLHEDKDEIVITIEGSVTAHFKGHESIVIGENETICIPAGIEHSLENIAEQDFKGIFLKIFV